MNKSISFQSISGVVFFCILPRLFPAFLTVWDGQAERETAFLDVKLHAARFRVCVGLAQLKQQGVVDPDIFISRSNQLAERLRELKLQKERILRSEEDHTIQQTQDLLDVLESGPDWLDDFDEQLFSDMIEKIVVVDNETLRFRLLNGLEVTEKIERTRR